ncbi:MAG: hypothetical protein LBT23_12790, partial [Synergistaceae bacterium]|nr:hypothetical protein [Synergistaceae bacterium]
MVYITAAALLFAFCAPSPVFAADTAFDDIEERLVAYGIQIGLAVADIVAMNLWENTIEDVDELFDKWARQKHANYATDHYLLSPENSTYSDASGYIIGYLGASEDITERYAGYRDMSSKLHSEAFSGQSGAFMERMKSMLGDNNRALRDIMSKQGDLNKMLNVSKKVYGYTRQIQATAQSANYLNQELTRLQVDIDGILGLEAEIALNEQQRQADDM